MYVNSDKKNYKIEHDIKTEKGKITILAVLEDVEVSIFKNIDDKKPTHTHKLKKNTVFSEIVDENSYYYLRITGDETVYGVIPGIAYYIAKAQVLVEADTNIIKKPHKKDDVDSELK